MTSIAKDRISRLGPVGRCGLLALVMASVLLLAMPIAYLLAGSAGVSAAVVAAIVVWLASAIGIVICEFFRGPNEVLWNLLFGMFFRMSIPLAVCLLVCLHGGPLASAGFVYFVLVFYLVSLPVDTMLTISGRDTTTA